MNEDMKDVGEMLLNGLYGKVHNRELVERLYNAMDRVRPKEHCPTFKTLTGHPLEPYPPGL